MQFNIIDKITKFFNWFVDFVAKPLGMATWSIVLILGGAYYGEYQREKEEVHGKEQSVANGIRIRQLEAKIDTLSNRIANTDCSEEVQKYVTLLQNIQIQTSQSKEEVQKRLELERKKTEELQNLKQSLNLK